MGGARLQEGEGGEGGAEGEAERRSAKVRLDLGREPQLLLSSTFRSSSLPDAPTEHASLSSTSDTDSLVLKHLSHLQRHLEPAAHSTRPSAPLPFTSSPFKPPFTIPTTPYSTTSTMPIRHDSDLDIALEKVVAVTAQHARDVRAALPLVRPSSRYTPQHSTSILTLLTATCRRVSGSIQSRQALPTDARAPRRADPARQRARP